MISKNVRIVALVVVGLFLANHFFNSEKPVSIDHDRPLIEENERDAIIIKDNKITHVSKDDEGNETVTTDYIPPDGGARIGVKNDGEVDIYVKNKGFAIAPTSGVLVGDDIRAIIGIDCIYYKRFTLNTGASLGKPVFVSPYVGVGYAPDWKWTNTAFLVGYDLNAKVFAGIKVRF